MVRSYLGRHIKAEIARLWSVETCSSSRVGRKRSSEHGPLALRPLLSGFVLQHIPVFDQNIILHAKNIDSDPIRGMTKRAETAMDHDPLALGENEPGFVPQRRRGVSDEIEQTLPARSDVGAVLDVTRRPIFLGRGVVAFVEEKVERSQNQVLFRSWVD